MSEKTKAQKWKQRLTDDCEVVGEPRNASHADSRYFDHLHDLSDCGYDRAEEVAASVSALTEEFSSFRMFTSANLRTADRSIAIERERIDAIEAKHGGSSDFYHEPVSPVPPPPGADEPARQPQTEGHAFVDALCREYARRCQSYGCDNLSMYLLAAFRFLTNGPEHDLANDAAMRARAAELPERSAAAPVTIPQAQFNRAAHVYEIATNERCNYQGLRAAVESLGIEIRPIEVEP